MSAITISPATPTDKNDIQALLLAADLPHQDFAAHLSHFQVARAGSQLVGAVGLEPYAGAGLLRSLVVDPAYRGQNLGQQLTAAILDYAHNLGLTDVYLLTTTADKFFPKFGFERCQREDAPDQIQATVEFASLCPSTAVCMVRKEPAHD